MMKKIKDKIIYSFVALLVPFLAVRAQSDYQVGISRVSTEPDSALFSVALSGYGYPPEGRFSIEWIHVGETPGNIVALAGLDGKFYATDSTGKLWKGIVSGKNVTWQKAGNARNIVALAGMNRMLYAVNKKGELLRSKSDRRIIKWRKIGNAGNINTLAALDGKLYACGPEGELLRADPDDRAVIWSPAGHTLAKVVSMTSHGHRLFAISPGDTLWHILPLKQGAPWTEIGRYNGITYNIYIKQLAVLNNRLYAISKDNKLFISRNNTDGDLSATAMAIKHRDKLVVLMGIDLTGFDYSLTDEVKSIVSRDMHIPKTAILINASHTHFSPSAQAYQAWMPFLDHPDSLYLNNILKKNMVKAIENALDSLSPADLYFGRGRTNIGLNRSAANPELPLDHTLDVLVAMSGHRIKGVLFLAACHAVFNNSGRESYTLSANFPGVTRQLIRKKTGANSVFIQGCAGDINPRSSNHVKTGTELAEDVFKIINKSMTKITGDISFTLDSIHIPITPWSIEKIQRFKEANENNNDPDAIKNVRWADLMLRRYRDEAILDYLPEYIQCINIGNWRLVGLSREVVNEYGPAIRKLWPGKIVSVAGYCNDVSSYLPKEWHVVTQTYEGYDSFFWYGQPGLPPINIFDIVVNGVKKLGE